MVRYILLAAAGGLASAVFNFSLMLGGVTAVVLTNLNALPLFLVGLGLGLPAVVAAAAVGAIAAGFFGGWTAGVTHAVASGLPAIVLCQRALLQRPDGQGGTDWYPLGRLCLWLIALGAGYFTFLLLRFSPQLEGLSGFFDELLSSAGQLDPAQRELMVERLSTLIPMLVTAFWMLSIVLDGALAQLILRRFKRNIRPSADLTSLHLPGMAAVMLLVALAMAFMPGPFGVMGRALIGLMLIAYFLQGLAVIHAVSRNWSLRSLFLVGTYLIVILTGWSMLVVALIGLLEHVYPFRKGSSGSSGSSGSPGAGPDQEEE